MPDQTQTQYRVIVKSLKTGDALAKSRPMSEEEASNVLSTYNSIDASNDTAFIKFTNDDGNIISFNGPSMRSFFLDIKALG